MDVLVVDDHAIVREGLGRLLAELPDMALFEAASGEEALTRITARRFALALLDLNLPGLGGLELLRRVVAADPHLPVLVFSLHTEPVYATRALEAGARGYVSKNAAPEELLGAVRTVLAGGTIIERDITEEMHAREAADNAWQRPLTQRDLEILRLLAEGNSLSEIAATLGIAYKTVANTLSRIKEKLGVSHTADLIRLTLGHGLA